MVRHQIGPLTTRACVCVCVCACTNVLPCVITHSVGDMPHPTPPHSLPPSRCIQNNPCAHKTHTNSVGIPSAAHKTYESLILYVNAQFRQKYSVQLGLVPKSAPSRLVFARWIEQGRDGQEQAKFMLVCESM